LIKIGIDARFAIHQRRGIGNYTLKLIQHLADMDASNQYILYVDNDEYEILPKNKNIVTKVIKPSNYMLWEQIALPMQAVKDGIQILHCPGNTAPLTLNGNIKLVASIMDVMYLKSYAELPKSSSIYQRAGRLYRRAVVPRSMNRLSRVITISHYSKKDIAKHFPDLGDEKIRVIYLAASERYRELDKGSSLRAVNDRFGIDGRYVMTLGAMDPRKNTEMVIRNYIELRNEKKISEKLFVIGISDWKQLNVPKEVQESRHWKDVIFVDYVTDDELVMIYNAAALFLYPSLYEGFGIPLLEAMACGTPIITSNTTAIPEIVGDSAYLISPRDGGQLKRAVVEMIRDDQARNAYIRKGLEKVKDYSWKKMAGETLNLYRQIAGEQGGFI
jgi:glycosyltransferase involved in cell wall biosynthesis